VSDGKRGMAEVRIREEGVSIKGTERMRREG
jgi:hypothetical protein